MILAELGGVHVEELEHAIWRRETYAEDVARVLRDRQPTTDPTLPDPEGHAARVISRERLEAPPGSAARAIVVRAIRDGSLEGHRNVGEILTGERSAIPDQKHLRRARTLKLSEIVAEYVGTLSARRTIREVEGALASFVRVSGDLPVDELSRDDFLAFCRDEGGRTVGGIDPGSVARPLSPDTLKKKLGLLRAAINKAIATGRFAGANPAAGIDAKHFTKPVPVALMPAKRPFDVHELRLLVLHPWFTGCESAQATHSPGSHRLQGMHYWGPLLAMHTGCRAGELGGLRLAEVRIDHEHPHLVVQDNAYRTTKGAYRRKIPLLDVLMEHGFGEYVEAQLRAGHDRLFPDWKAPAGRIDASATAWSNTSMVRAFNRTLVRQQLSSLLTAGTRQEVTFHSLRGAFKTLLSRAEYALPVNYIHEVVGHEKFALDKRYIGEVPLADTYPATRKCRYADLTLPPAPSG